METLSNGRESKAGLRLASVGAAVVFMLAFGGPAASAKPPHFEAYGSCDTAKPFKAADSCAFDRHEHAQGTIVFRSHVGKRSLKVCQKILGLSFHGQQCLKAKEPTAYEAIPFELNGAYNDFKVVVTIYSKPPGSSAPYAKAARVQLRFHA
jgi:hypothetical protein